MKRLLLALLISIFSCSVFSQSDISGFLRYANTVQTPLDGVTIFLETALGQKLDSIKTNQSGYYLFRNVPAGQYLIKPDCKKPWGGVNSLDALLIQEYFTGMMGLTPIELAAADVNASGTVNATDALQVLQRFVWIITSFQAGSWAFTDETTESDGLNPVILNIDALCFGDVNGSYTPPPCVPHPTQANAGQDMPDLPGTSVTLNANVALTGTGQWQLISGANSTISNPNIPNPLFTGIPGIEYILSWNISTACYSSKDTVIFNFAQAYGTPCPGLASFSYAGQTYHTVEIGGQCWMRENLNIGSMINQFSDQTNNNIIEKYCYNDDPVNCTIYGGLYQWNEMMNYTNNPGTQGICPSGFRLPKEDDWNSLISSLGGYQVAGGKMKETGLNHWNSPNTGATNESGFTALGAGDRDISGDYFNLMEYTEFWSSSPFDNNNAWIRSIYFNHENIYFYGQNPKSSGISVRCLKDTCSMPPSQSNAGPDQVITANSTILAGNVPQSGTGYWSMVSGTGGLITDNSNPISTFTGLTDTAYVLVWTISTPCSSTSDTVNITVSISQSGSPCPGIASFVYGGQTYNTVQIGSQCWMKENLNIGSMIDGISDQSDNGVIEKYCYDDDPANCANFGGLYQWNEMMQYTTTEGAQGICPGGFHVPTDAEWTTVEDFLGGSPGAGGKLKDDGFAHWQTPNAGATNASGFTGLGAGARYFGGSFSDLQQDGYFWSSTQDGANIAWLRYLFYIDDNVTWSSATKTFGFSVRCIKN